MSLLIQRCKADRVLCQLEGRKEVIATLKECEWQLNREESPVLEVPLSVFPSAVCLADNLLLTVNNHYSPCSWLLSLLKPIYTCGESDGDGSCSGREACLRSSAVPPGGVILLCAPREGLIIRPLWVRHPQCPASTFICPFPL